MTFDELPKEIQDVILKMLSGQEAKDVSLTSKRFLELVQTRIWKQAGAADYEDFLMRIRLLPKKSQQMILNNQWNLAFAENLKRILALSMEERERELLTPEQATALRSHTYNYLQPLLNENGIIALLEHILTPEEADSLPSQIQLHYLLRDVGLILLRENLITVLHVSPMNESLCYEFLTENGLKALREHLITPDQVLLFNNLGFNVAGNFQCLRVLLSEKGLTALREKLITPEAAARVRNSGALEKIIDDCITMLELKKDPTRKLQI